MPRCTYCNTELTEFLVVVIHNDFRRPTPVCDRCPARYHIPIDDALHCSIANPPTVMVADRRLAELEYSTKIVHDNLVANRGYITKIVAVRKLLEHIRNAIAVVPYMEGNNSTDFKSLVGRISRHFDSLGYKYPSELQCYIPQPITFHCGAIDVQFNMDVPKCPGTSVMHVGERITLVTSATRVIVQHIANTVQILEVYAHFVAPLVLTNGNLYIYTPAENTRGCSREFEMTGAHAWQPVHLWMSTEINDREWDVRLPLHVRRVVERIAHHRTISVNITHRDC